MGNELTSGKFHSVESSAALAANTFGYFLERPGEMPRLPGTDDCQWPALSSRLILPFEVVRPEIWLSSQGGPR